MHDRNGTPIQTGDIVMIECRVAETYAAADYCNARLEVGFEKPHGPDNVTGGITINARQALLVKRAPTPDAAPAAARRGARRRRVTSPDEAPRARPPPAPRSRGAVWDATPSTAPPAAESDPF